MLSLFLICDATQCNAVLHALIPQPSSASAGFQRCVLNPDDTMRRMFIDRDDAILQHLTKVEARRSGCPAALTALCIDYRSPQDVIELVRKVSCPHDIWADNDHGVFCRLDALITASDNGIRWWDASSI